jgi:hypothetical protein
VTRQKVVARFPGWPTTPIFSVFLGQTRHPLHLVIVDLFSMVTRKDTIRSYLKVHKSSLGRAVSSFFLIRQGLSILALRLMALGKVSKFFRLHLLQLSDPADWSRMNFKSLNLVETWISAPPKSKSSGNRALALSKSYVGYSEHKAGLVAANTRYSGIIKKASFLLAPSLVESPLSLITSYPSVSGFIASENATIMVKIRAEKKIESGIFCGSLSPHNWYHWLIDTLPAVYLTSLLPTKYAKVPILVPELILEKSHWMEALSLVSADRPIVPISVDSYLNVSNLVWIHGPTMRGSLPSNAGNLMLAIEQNSMNGFRKRILDQLGLEFIANRPRPRVFLARREGSLRPYNQEKITEIARKYDFQLIHQEDLGLSELIDVLLHAEYIVGPHGAGWATALFSESAAGALLWTWDGGWRENWFQNVLTIRGIPYTTIETGPGHNSSGYWLNPETFEEELLKMVPTS